MTKEDRKKVPTSTITKKNAGKFGVPSENQQK